MVTLNSVTKKFKEFTAIDNLSFDIAKGEVVGLLGENGAGKTTTLRMIATILKPTSGMIQIAQHDAIDEPQEVRKRIGILFGGETGLYDRLTARENISYFGELYGLTANQIKRRTDELAEQFGMGEYIDKRVGGFSKGMRQKTAIARSIVHQPDIILFDEPTSGLDITSANVIRQLIQEFRSEGKTVIFSSHIMGEVSRLCDRVIILHKGKMQYNGSLTHLYEQYHSQDLDHIFMTMAGGQS